MSVRSNRKYLLCFTKNSWKKLNFHLFSEEYSRLKTAEFHVSQKAGHDARGNTVTVVFHTRADETRYRRNEWWWISDYRQGGAVNSVPAQTGSPKRLRRGTEHRLPTRSTLVSIKWNSRTKSLLKSQQLLIAVLFGSDGLVRDVTFGCCHINKRLLLILCLACFYHKFRQAAGSFLRSWVQNWSLCP